MTDPGMLALALKIKEISQAALRVVHDEVGGHAHKAMGVIVGMIYLLLQDLSREGRLALLDELEEAVAEMRRREGADA